MTVTYEDYLAHYGVLGMKWGIRRYQPYPSGKKGVYLGDKSGAQPLRYRSMAAATAKEFGKQFVNHMIAAIIPGAGLAINAVNVARATKYFDGTDYVKKDGGLLKVSELKKKTSKTTMEQDAMVTNPGSSKKGRLKNCAYCTTAYELRRRGYDVEARRKASGTATDKYSDWFKGVDYKVSKTDRQPGQSRKDWAMASYNNLCKKLEGYPNGARGFVTIQYDKLGANGHTFSWEIQGGQVKFIDPQAGNSKPVDQSFSFSDQNFVYGRLDNLQVKPEITETCMNKKSR